MSTSNANDAHDKGDCDTDTKDMSPSPNIEIIKSTETVKTQMEKNIIELREEFLKKHKEDVDADCYSPPDLSMIRETDRLLECFLMSSEGDLAVTVDNLHNALLARKQYNMSHLQESDLCQEVIDRRVLYWQGKDKDASPVLHFRVANHKKSSLMDSTKQFIVYTLNKHYMHNMGQEVYIVFDFTSAGIMNMDLELTKFIITSLTTYFPHTTKRILLFDMPFLLYAAWKVVKSWLTSAQKARIMDVNKTSIADLIDPSQLMDHMKK